MLLPQSINVEWCLDLNQRTIHWGIFLGVLISGGQLTVKQNAVIIN